MAEVVLMLIIGITFAIIIINGILQDIFRNLRK